MILASPKQLSRQSVLRGPLFIVFTLFWLTASAQESGSDSIAEDAEISSLSALELYKKAKSIKQKDHHKSIRLANEALRKSEVNNNHRLSAQTHTLLGKLARESKRIDQSIQHFLQASTIYQKTNDKRNQILSRVESANTLIAEKRYAEAEEIINQILPTAQKHNENLPLAVIHMTKGDSFYRQKRYKNAIAEYTLALTLLSDEDHEVKKRLALTYQKAAQTYTRLENTEKAIDFYQNALVLYTELNNKKSMANTLRNLATQERYRANYLTALDYAIRGLKIQRQLSDKTSLAKALTSTGIIYRFLGRYEKSLTHIQEAHLIYKQKNSISNIASTSKEIGLIYTRLQQFDQARSFYQLTINLPKEQVDIKTRAAALREIAVIDLNSGNYQSAETMAKDAYAIYKLASDKVKMALSKRILGNIYNAQNNQAKAITFYREAVSLATEVGNKKEQIIALTLLGNNLISENPEEAITHLKKALALATQSHAKKDQLSAYQSLRLAEKARGNISEYLRYTENELALSKLYYAEREETGLVQEKAKLDSHKKEMELESLREKAKLDQLELIKKNNEIEIVNQASQIYELERAKNRYTNIALTSLLIICSLAVLFTYRRFIDSRKQNRKLDYLATHDPHTNCYNRRILFDLLERDFAKLDQLGDYCIIMADIDHFKAVNDTYGHCAGDVILRGVANILQKEVRKNDITVRFGGEEFCIVLPGANEQQAMNIAESMRKKIEAKLFEGDLKITCSFGVTSIKFNAKTPTDLIDQADLALYESKTLGRNQVTLWDSSLK